MPGPLAGFRIVDLSAVVSGPLATMLLADQGAEVIKIEPSGGDTTRLPLFERGGITPLFANVNRGKRSLVLDLGQPRAREIVLQLAAEADVFVQNFRPGAIERMGLGEDAIRACAATSCMSRSTASARRGLMQNAVPTIRSSRA